MARPQPIVVPGGLSTKKSFTDINVDVGALVQLFEGIRQKNIEARRQQEFGEQFGSVFAQEVPAAGPQLPAGGIEEVGIAQEGAELAPPPTAQEIPENVQALGRLLSGTPQGRAQGRQVAIQELQRQITPAKVELTEFEKAFQKEAGKREAASRFVTPGSSFSKIDPKNYTRKSIANFEKSGSFADLEVRPDALRKITGGKSPQQIETDLRKEFTGLSKDFRVVRDSFERIKASADDPSAAGDLALIFNYMKVLDPGSTVREGEFATAQNAASVPERIRAQYGKVISGERLSAATRDDFLNRAGKLFNSQNRIHKKRENTFRGIAKEKEGVNPKNVVIDLSAPEFDEEAARTGGTVGAAVIETLPEGATQIGTSGGKRVFKIGDKTFIEE